MKTVFLIGLLAVSTAAYNRYAPDYGYPVRRNLPFGYWPPYDLDDYYDVESTETEPEPQPEPQPQPEPETTPEPQPETTTKPYPLPYKEDSIRQEIDTFGGQMIAYSLNLKNFLCDLCFPFSTFSMDIVDLLAVKSLLKKIYGTEFEHLVQQGPIAYHHKIERKNLNIDIYNGQREILNTWNDVWLALENKTFEKYWKQVQAQSDVLRHFMATFDDEKIIESDKRFFKVFGPGLNRTTDVQNLVSAVRYFEQPEIISRTLRSVSYDGIPHEIEQKQLVEKIHTFIRRMFTYVYNLDPLGKDYMTGFIADHLKGFSIKSLLIFDHYLEKTFGKAMSEIPEKPLPSAQERREKVQIVRELKDMMTTTLNVWHQDLSTVMRKDVKERSFRVYQEMFEGHANILADFLSLEDLRRVLRKAMPILGWAKKAIVIPEDDI